ncbi:hypothetical protein ACLMJK_009351 [Lecanora helva]
MSQHSRENWGHGHWQPGHRPSRSEPLQNITNRPDFAEASAPLHQPTTGFPLNPPTSQLSPSNSDADNPKIPPHFAYNPTMMVLAREGPLLTSYLEMEPKLYEILDSVQPHFCKAICGLYTMGREEDVEPSKTNPAVVVIRVHREDRQRAEEVHDRIVRLIQDFLPSPVPPFRWIVQYIVPFGRDPLPRPQGHRRQRSQQHHFDEIYGQQ